jgi:alpha-galactosidase
LKRLEDLVTRYKPAYIKVDLTTVFNAYGEAPGCYASGHAHHDWTESLTRIYEGLIYIGQQLYRTHPEVLVDYTFELWGEKHLIDPALLEAADLDWLSNINDRDADSGGPLQARTLLYQRAPSIPVESMLIGNLRAATGSIEEHFGTAIGSAPLFLGDLRKLSESDRKWYAERTRWYLDLRRRSSLPDSFFPLGSWQQPAASSWDGFARLSSESDGIIAIFKNQSHAESAQIRLVAPPDARYEVRSEITGKALGRVMASTLRDGWKVAIPSEHAVEVLELRRTKP